MLLPCYQTIPNVKAKESKPTRDPAQLQLRARSNHFSARKLILDPGAQCGVSSETGRHAAFQYLAKSDAALVLEQDSLNDSCKHSTPQEVVTAAPSYALVVYALPRCRNHLARNKTNQMLQSSVAQSANGRPSSLARSTIKNGSANYTYCREIPKCI